jgi:hypothetical protein
MKKTVVIGASTNPERYSYKAIEALVNHGIDTFALGLRKGTVAGINILLKPENDIHCDKCNKCHSKAPHYYCQYC